MYPYSLDLLSNDEQRIHLPQNIGQSQNETWLPPLDLDTLAASSFDHILYTCRSIDLDLKPVLVESRNLARSS